MEEFETKLNEFFGIVADAVYDYGEHRVAEAFLRQFSGGDAEEAETFTKVWQHVEVLQMQERTARHRQQRGGTAQ